MANLKAADPNGRPEYPQPPALDDRLKEKNDALAERIALMQAQEAAELARFGPAPAPKATKAK